MNEKNNNTLWMLIFISWLMVSFSTLGSLFFSEVMELPPCELCWYQRIFMFPLAILLLIGLFPRLDTHVLRYALPLAVLGWMTALYHLLLYKGFIPESLQPCGQGPSCAKIDLELFGFVTIPLLSLLAFSIIVILLYLAKKRLPHE